jgi:biopolymer transport protein ExbD
MKVLCAEDESQGVRIAPLIDIVFLLLIFFLVATTFYEAEKDITIRLAGATEGRERSPTPELVTVNITEAGAMIINQRLYTLDQLEAHLRDARARNPKVAAVLRCDRRARHAEFVNALNICERTGVSQVSVATFQTDEKR